MNRRGFLKRAGASALAVVAAPLFIPAERLAYGVPKPPVVPRIEDASGFGYDLVDRGWEHSRPFSKPTTYFVKGDSGIALPKWAAYFGNPEVFQGALTPELVASSRDWATHVMQTYTPKQYHTKLAVQQADDDPLVHALVQRLDPGAIERYKEWMDAEI